MGSSLKSSLVYLCIFICAVTCGGKKMYEDKEILKLHNNFVSSKNKPKISKDEHYTNSIENTKTLGKSRGTLFSTVRPLKEHNYSSLFSQNHTIKSKQSFILGENQSRRDEKRFHLRHNKHLSRRRRFRRRNRKKLIKTRYFNIKRKNRLPCHKRRTYKKRYQKYSRKIELKRKIFHRRRKYWLQTGGRKGMRRLKGKYLRRLKNKFKNNNKRLRQKYHVHITKRIFWHRIGKNGFRNYSHSGNRGRRRSRNIYCRRRMFRHRKRLYRFRKQSARRRRKQFKYVHRYHGRRMFRHRKRKYKLGKQSRRRRRKQFKYLHRYYRGNRYRLSKLETSPIYAGRQRPASFVSTIHNSGWLHGFGKRGIISIRHPLWAIQEIDRRHLGRTMGLRKQEKINWIGRYWRRYTNKRYSKHHRHLNRYNYRNLYGYSRSQFPHRRAQPVSLNRNPYHGLLHHGKLVVGSRRRTRYIQEKEGVNNPYINHNRKKTYKGHSDVIGKRQVKDTYGLINSIKTSAVHNKSRTYNYEPDKKHPWIF